MPSWSRARPRSAGPFKESYVRTTVNQVSGVLEHTILDDVQIAYEHAVREFSRLAKFGGDTQKERRFLEKCVLYCLEGLMWNPHSEKNSTELGRVRELCLTLADRLSICSRLLGAKAEAAVFEGEGAGV